MNVLLSTRHKSLFVNTGSYKSVAGSKKKESAVDELTKQKQSLEDSKNSTIKQALKDGTDPKTLKAKLDEFDKKIAELDKQIAKAQIEEKSKTSDDNGTKSSNSTNSSKTVSKNGLKNADSTKQLSAILNVSSKLKENSMLAAQGASMAGEINVLNSDIKLDEGRGSNTASAQKRVSELEDNISNIYEQMGENNGSINGGTDDSGVSDVLGKDKISDGNKEDKSDINAAGHKAIENYTAKHEDKEKDAGAKIDTTA